jgi:hypothetical protein
MRKASGGRKEPKLPTCEEVACPWVRPFSGLPLMRCVRVTGTDVRRG